MKKLIPFIPVLGFFLTGYYMLVKNESVGIEKNTSVFWITAAIQAIGFCAIFLCLY
jgi:hypothetical protein